MNRTILSLLVLLLLGLFSQPSIAQSRQQDAQQQAEKNVAQMSEEQMREYLPQAKERLKKPQRDLKTGNYGGGDDAISQGVGKAAAEFLYYYYTAAINAIEKRLHKIDSQKPKPQTEQPQAETEQQQQEIPDQNLEEQRQIQAKLQQSFDEKIEESQPRFNQLHTNVDASSKAIREENWALKSVISNTDPNSVRVTDDMLDKRLSSTSKTNSGKRDGSIGISSKFNNKPKETKKEPEETPDVVEPDEPKEEVSEEDEIRKLIMEIQNDINNF